MNLFSSELQNSSSLKYWMPILGAGCIVILGVFLHSVVAFNIYTGLPDYSDRSTSLNIFVGFNLVVRVSSKFFSWLFSALYLTALLQTININKHDLSEFSFASLFYLLYPFIIILSIEDYLKTVIISMLSIKGHLMNFQDIKISLGLNQVLEKESLHPLIYELLGEITPTVLLGYVFLTDWICEKLQQNKFVIIVILSFLWITQGLVTAVWKLSIQ